MNKFLLTLSAVALVTSLQSCKMKTTESAVAGDAASKVYVAPGKYDEFYSFVAGGFSCEVIGFVLPSGRL